MPQSASERHPPFKAAPPDAMNCSSLTRSKRSCRPKRTAPGRRLSRDSSYTRARVIPSHAATWGADSSAGAGDSTTRAWEVSAVAALFCGSLLRCARRAGRPDFVPIVPPSGGWKTQSAGTHSLAPQKFAMRSCESRRRTAHLHRVGEISGTVAVSPRRAVRTAVLFLPATGLRRLRVPDTARMDANPIDQGKPSRRAPMAYMIGNSYAGVKLTLCNCDSWTVGPYPLWGVARWGV